MCLARVVVTGQLWGVGLEVLTQAGGHLPAGRWLRKSSFVSWRELEPERPKSVRPLHRLGRSCLPAWDKGGAVESPCHRDQVPGSMGWPSKVMAELSRKPRMAAGSLSVCSPPPPPTLEGQY